MEEVVETSQIPEELKGLARVDGISVSDGLLYCGNAGDFVNFLESFYQDIDIQADEIEDAFRKGDLTFFTIRVHALKTSARVIGAAGLAEISAALESAGKAGDIEFIQNNIEVLLSLHKSYKNRLEGYFTEKQKQRTIKKTISTKELEDSWRGTMGQIMILGTKESFIIRVLLKKLADAGIKANFITMDLDKINTNWEDTSLVTFYMEKDERLPDDIKTFLVDKLEQDDKRIVLIGEPIDTEDKSIGIPPHLIFGRLPRPLDYDDYIACVNSYNKKASSGDLKRKILIVDDDPNYMSLVREWMVEDYKVSMVTSGMRAIKWLGANKVDLILLDYEMPVTSGPQVLEMLRADDETKDIPVIFLTGNDSKESVMSVMNLKPQGYFLKTMPKDEFLNKIKVFFMKQSDE